MIMLKRDFTDNQIDMISQIGNITATISVAIGFLIAISFDFDLLSKLPSVVVYILLGIVLLGLVASCACWWFAESCLKNAKKERESHQS